MSLSIIDPYKFAAIAVGGWKVVDKAVLGSPADNITVNVSDKRYYMFLAHTLPSGLNSHRLRLNGDVNTNYAERWENDGGTENALNTQNRMSLISDNSAFQTFSIGFLDNVSSKEKKLIYGRTCKAKATDASAAPSRAESAGKHDQVSNPISSITLHNNESGDFNTNSELVVLGYDEDDIHTDNAWEELVNVVQPSDANSIDSGSFTAKKYLWIQVYLKGPISGGSNNWIEFNGDQTASYASRNSSNNGSEQTLNSRTDGAFVAHLQAGEFAHARFFNIFMVNSSSHLKLLIAHGMSKQTADATTAPQRTEGAALWDETAAQATSFKFFNGGTSQVKQNSVLKVWGFNP